MRATPDPDDAFSVPGDRILGLDNVPIELPLATAGSRSLAAFVDYVALGALSVGLAVIAVVVRFAAFDLSRDPSRAWWILGFLTFGFFVLEYGYFAGCEILMDGQTLGKRAVGLRVVTRSGARPGAAAFLIRNCVRTIDLLVGVLLMAFDPLNRRLGDRLAGTLVVRAARRRQALLVIERVPRGWQGREIAIAEGFLRRAATLDPSRVEPLARELLAALARTDPELAAQALPSESAFATLTRLLAVRESSR